MPRLRFENGDIKAKGIIEIAQSTFLRPTDVRSMDTNQNFSFEAPLGANKNIVQNVVLSICDPAGSHDGILQAHVRD